MLVSVSLNKQGHSLNFKLLILQNEFMIGLT